MHFWQGGSNWKCIRNQGYFRINIFYDVLSLSFIKRWKPKSNGIVNDLVFKTSVFPAELIVSLAWKTVQFSNLTEETIQLNCTLYATCKYLILLLPMNFYNTEVMELKWNVELLLLVVCITVLYMGAAVYTTSVIYTDVTWLWSMRLWRNYDTKNAY